MSKLYPFGAKPEIRKLPTKCDQIKNPPKTFKELKARLGK